jgi:hypothetical protein
VSLGIAFKGPEGIVLAADSRVTLTAFVQTPNQPQMFVPSTFDNATKLLKVKGQDHVGAVTYGAGAIGQAEPRTAHSYMPELEQELAGSGRLSVQQFAEHLSRFFLDKWQSQNMPVGAGDMVFLVGGYDQEGTYGRVYQIYIPSKPDPHEWHGGAGEFGLVWGGQSEYAGRLIHGFDGRLPELATAFLGLDAQRGAELRQHLQSTLQAPIPFSFLPLQDSIDFAIFLIRTTMVMQHWLVGVRGVGGKIDVAVVTRTEGFKEIQKKKLGGEELS